MRRAKKIRCKIAGCLFNIVYIMFGVLTKPTQMIISVIPYAMSMFNDHIELIGMLTHIVPHHKKGGLDVILIQNA